MSAAIPNVITSYFQATDARDVAALLSCFTDDAAVTDEGKTIHGLTEIRAWRDNVASVYQYTVEILDADEQPDAEYVLTARLEGTFPGSPVDLRFRFVVQGDLISELEIAP